MKDFFVGLLIWIVTIVLIGVIGIAGQIAGLWNYQYFAPKYEDARREVFENTQSYVEGKRQEVSKYRLEYKRAKDESDKEAIAELIRNTFANVDLSKLSYEDRTFIESLQ